MVVDANAGIVGSEALVDVAEGLRYGTNTPIGGGGGENGGGIARRPWPKIIPFWSSTRRAASLSTSTAA